MLAAIALSTLLAGSPDGCVLEGKVTLTRSGKAVSAMNRVVVFVDNYREPKLRKPDTQSLRQKGLQFDKAVVVVQRHDRIQVFNDDKEEHNVFSRQYKNAFGPKPLSKGEVTDEPNFPSAGHTRIQCDIHGWMRTDVLVVKNSAWDKVKGDDGRFRIGGLPRGSYALVAWEPNGTRLDVGTFECQGTTSVPEFTLAEAPEPEMLHSDNRPFAGEYSRQHGPVVDRFRAEQ